MPDEIVPGLYRLLLPGPSTSLGSVNAYAVVDSDGIRLIDCGWNTPAAYAALVCEVEALGAQVSDIRAILVTHNHPDHIGLAEHLVAESGARLLLHQREAAFLGASVEDRQGFLADTQTWLRTNGMPQEELETIASGVRRMAFRPPACRPDTLLEGGEVLPWNGFHFVVIWTPGHAPGLVCLYEPRSQLLIASDHVLERISPFIGLHTRNFGDPLGAYLRSLQRVRALPAKRVLPGHGEPFSDLAGRVDALMQHHTLRLQEIVSVLAAEEQTAYLIASRLSWRGSEHSWQQLPPFDRLAATSEALAHLEYLASQGQVIKQVRSGTLFYRTTRPASGHHV